MSIHRIALSALVAVAMSGATAFAQERSPLDPTGWGVVYDVPATRDVTLRADVPYLTDARGALTLDVYVPPGAKAGERRPAVVFLNAIGDRPGDKTKDPRRVEGPIPVECRTAACGTCWIGVLGGAENLSPVDDREWRKMKEFGYLDTDEPKPLVRLACRAKTHGQVSIVVPPWNGVFGKLVDGKLEIDEEPASTSA